MTGEVVDSHGLPLFITKLLVSSRFDRLEEYSDMPCTCEDRFVLLESVCIV
jgi:hypothetical protein